MPSVRSKVSALRSWNSSSTPMLRGSERLNSIFTVLPERLAHELIKECRPYLEDPLVDVKGGAMQRDIFPVLDARAKADIATGEFLKVIGEVLRAHAGVIHHHHSLFTYDLRRRTVSDFRLAPGVDHGRIARV